MAPLCLVKLLDIEDIFRWNIALISLIANQMIID